MSNVLNQKFYTFSSSSSLELEDQPREGGNTSDPIPDTTALYMNKYLDTIFFWWDGKIFDICLRKIGSIKDVDLCFEKDPYKPLLHCNERIDSNPSRYNRYRSSLHLIENRVNYKTQIL
ncbi:hypothetical protein BDF21DRAFT_404516 [Thamnidium elegans]|nr:hypothetical protein BDF21DRAFT_404516 [Thamnidium elegans]